MHRIRLGDARIGMVVAADVANAQQMLLVKRGTCLTAQHLRVLKSWGIDSLDVQVADEEDTAHAKAAANTAELEGETRSRFRDAAETPIAAEICRVAAEIIHARLHPKG